MDRPHGDHVRLLAGSDSAGSPVYEEVPAARGDDGAWTLLGTPGLALGCAAGDRLVVEVDGKFRVVQRGGNLAVLSYTGSDVASDALDALREGFRALGGKVEVPPDGRFVVITVPVTAGFASVEAEMSAWAVRTGYDWHFGNVYDEADRPLNWWS